MLIIAAVIAVWQLLRIPFEGSTRISLAHAHDWLALERDAAHRHRALRAALRARARLAATTARSASMRNFDETFVIGFMAIARLLDPIRYPEAAHAFALLHVPALAILALYPLAPPHWVAGVPFADGPPAHPSALRNETAAAVSLHFGDTIFIVAGAALAAAASTAGVARAALSGRRVRRHPRHRKPLSSSTRSSARPACSSASPRRIDPWPAAARRGVCELVANRACGNRVRASLRLQSTEDSLEKSYERSQRSLAQRAFASRPQRAAAKSHPGSNGHARSSSSSRACWSTSASAPRPATMRRSPRRTPARSSISSRRSRDRPRGRSAAT